MKRLPAGALVVLLIALTAFQCTLALPSSTDLRDFGGAVASVQALNLGQNPYAHYPTLPNNPELQGITPNINLPVTLILLQPLVALPPRVAYWLWLALSAVGYIAVLACLRHLYPGMATPLRLSWAVALTPFWWTLHSNQVYVALLVAVLFALYHLDRQKHLAAGLAIGFLVAVKPNFAVWPALLFLAGHGRVAVVAFAFAGVLSLLPLILYGQTIYAQWYATISSANYQLMLGENVSLWSLFAHLGATWLGTALAVALLGVLALWAWRARPSAAETTLPAIAGALLATPISWPGYVVLLLPWFFRREWTTSYRFAAFAAVTPFPFGTLYTLPLLALIAADLRRASLSLKDA